MLQDTKYTLTPEVLPEWKSIVNKGDCIDINNALNIQKIICKPRIVIFELISVMVELELIGKMDCKYVQASPEYFKLNSQIAFTKYWPYQHFINRM